MARWNLKEKIEGKGPRELATDSRYATLLSVVFLFALWIRLIPRGSMRYLQALDPYFIARMSQMIVTEGHLPLFDIWRYFPYSTPSFSFSLGSMFIPAYLYKAVSFTGLDFLSWAQIYPAIAGALMVVAMYFAGKELFNREAGLLAAFFLATAPSVLHRSSAGWFEKEPLSAFLMITSIYFVTRGWKRKSWISGGVAGVCAGISMTVWGGTNFLFLLFPAILFPALLVTDDFEQIIAAFTPAIILGHMVPGILVPVEYSVPNGMLFASLGLLAVAWARHLIERYEVLSGKQLRYSVPGMYLLGGFALFLSPLYSQWLAGVMQSIIGKVAQNPGGVVGGTVAENQPARAGQIIGQLGAFRSQQVLPASIASASEFFSGWTFALIGTAVLITVVTGMLARRAGYLDETSPRTGYFSFLGALIGLTVLMVAMLPGTPFTAFLFAATVAVLGAGLLLLFPREGGLQPPQKWYLLIPLLWILSTLYGAAQKSRLLFLTAQPVALMAGYGLSVGLSELRNSSLWEEVQGAETDIDPRRALRILLVLVLVPVVVFNAAAAYGMAQGIGGSPNGAWMENLEFMRQETPIDSVVLSWWDYGYWFETIGARAAVADGGNLGFYTQPGEKKINFPLADFLTSKNYTAHMDWLESLSVDYVVLDSTMIGKYSAVSQIHRRSNNQFNSMQTFSCRSQNNRCLTTEANNKTYLMYQDRGVRLLVPFKKGLEELSIDGTPLMQTNRGTAAVGKICTEEGVKEVDVPENRSALPGCVSFHPYRQHQSLIYIPKEVMGSTLVRLYVMDAYGMAHFDEVFDNGFVKMWKVDYTPNQ